jgi:hypothetical protein
MGVDCYLSGSVDNAAVGTWDKSGNCFILVLYFFLRSPVEAVVFLLLAELELSLFTEVSFLNRILFLAPSPLGSGS